MIRMSGRINRAEDGARRVAGESQNPGWSETSLAFIDAGFEDVKVAARYECYGHRTLIAEYLAQQLDGGTVERQRAATALRKWAQQPAGLLAQCWIAATGRAPSP
jgi:hypothetical protein